MPTTSFDRTELERKVKGVYRAIAEAPGEEYHFEMGRELADRLGYPDADLDGVPEQALESFARVGYHFDLAALEEGDDVLDLGSGSGTDTFVAALHVGEAGSVTGVDMTVEQLEKARQLRDDSGPDTVVFEESYIGDLPVADDSVDVVVSNGVINLSAEKDRVFAEAERVLRPGGRLAISDIISETEMPDSIKTNADLWAACIGGAMQINAFTDLVESSGFDVVELRENPQYDFVSEQALGACQKYGVKSVSLGARRR